MSCGARVRRPAMVARDRGRATRTVYTGRAPQPRTRESVVGCYPYRYAIMLHLKHILPLLVAGSGSRSRTSEGTSG